jgi:hypothetical protein
MIMAPPPLSLTSMAQILVFPVFASPVNTGNDAILDYGLI